MSAASQITPFRCASGTSAIGIVRRPSVMSYEVNEQAKSISIGITRREYREITQVDCRTQRLPYHQPHLGCEAVSASMEGKEFWLGFGRSQSRIFGASEI
jgi:hypothetical protein